MSHPNALGGNSTLNLRTDGTTPPRPQILPARFTHTPAMSDRIPEPGPGPELGPGLGLSLGLGLAQDGDAVPAQAHHDPVAVAEQIGRPRTATTTAEIDSTINHPGSVRINVKGAFIVDQGSSSPTAAAPHFNGRGSPDHQTKDIRLPNHTAVVSHIAIDVSSLRSPAPRAQTRDGFELLPRSRDVSLDRTQERASD